MTWKSVVIVVGGILVIAAAAAAISVSYFDGYARGEVLVRAEKEYFSGVEEFVVKAAQKKLQEAGCDEKRGISVARDFLSRERRHFALSVTRQPEWGWEVEGYRFAVLWRSERIATFRLNEKHRPIARQVHSTLPARIEAEICEPACGWWKCWLNERIAN